MNERAFYKGVDPEIWAAQERWAIERYGPGAATGIRQRNDVMSDWTQADYDRHAAGYRALWSDYAQALSNGLPADSDHVRAITRRLHGLLGDAAPAPLCRMRFSAVAGVYEEEPQLRSSLDARAPGLTDYVVSAMRAFAQDIA